MEVFDFIGTKLSDFLTYTGFANAEMGNWIMILVGAFFLWLAIKKDFEPDAPMWPWPRAIGNIYNMQPTVLPSKVRWKYASFARCSSNSRLHLILQIIFCKLRQ